MGVSWAFVVLLVYPALQVPLLWVVVRHFGLRNDDGPGPEGYSFHADEGGADGPGHCKNCGRQNVPAAGYCALCLSRLQ